MTVQRFQSPCTCTARRALPVNFIPFDRANQDLQNVFLDESLAQKETKLWSFKVARLLLIIISFALYIGLFFDPVFW